MQFNSYLFIFFFLPFSVVLYFSANRIKPFFGKVVLIVSSLLFYSWGRVNMLIYFAISIVINYSAAKMMKYKTEHMRTIQILAIVVNIGILFYFKYSNFLLENIANILGTSFSYKSIILPLGISFYTFQQISYLCETARGKVIIEDDLIDYLVYILYFPKLLMGPLVEPSDFIHQINDLEKKRPDSQNIAKGIKLFSFGLLKKVFFADTFAKPVSWVYGNLSSATSLDCVLMAVFYTFQLYFDFSGYCDMATGVSFMMNIEMPINFNSPYKAVSIRDFWKRWHMSLTRFFTKYVYIPLGGSRKGEFYTYVNIMIVFLISGLWHGAGWTFIIWGFLNGILCCIDRRFEKLEEKVFKPFRWVVTFGITVFLWSLFSAPSFSTWITVLKKTFSVNGISVSLGLRESFDISWISALFDTVGLRFITSRLSGINKIVLLAFTSYLLFLPDNNYNTQNELNVKTVILAGIAFFLGVAYLSSESVFVYFGF